MVSALKESLYCESFGSNGWSYNELKVETRPSLCCISTLYVFLSHKAGLCFSRPPALSHDLPGREQLPTKESVDTETLETQDTCIIWAKSLKSPFAKGGG